MFVMLNVLVKMEDGCEVLVECCYDMQMCQCYLFIFIDGVCIVG